MSKTEHKKMREWRERNGWSREQLARLTGYTAKSIYWYEMGHTPEGEPQKDWVLHRYRMACAGVEYEQSHEAMPLGETFDW